MGHHFTFQPCCAISRIEKSGLSPDNYNGKDDIELLFKLSFYISLERIQIRIRSIGSGQECHDSNITDSATHKLIERRLNKGIKCARLERKDLDAGGGRYQLTLQTIRATNENACQVGVITILHLIVIRLMIGSDNRKHFYIIIFFFYPFFCPVERWYPMFVRA